jgi:G3E family GTPase
VTRPVFIVSGFLGAGKTSLILSLIRRGSIRDAVLIINDFGDISLDAQLIASSGETVVELESGCICCSAKDDLIKSLHDIAQSHPDKKSVWIETSGISSPGDLLPLFTSNPVIASNFFVEQVITVVDSRTSVEDLSRAGTVFEQLAFASTIFVNIFDDYCEPSSKLLEWLRSVNSAANYLIAPIDDIELSQLKSGFDYRFSLERTDHLVAMNNGIKEHGFQTFTIRWEGSIIISDLSTILDDWLMSDGKNLLRMKGVAFCEESNLSIIIQGVRRQIIFDEPSNMDWSEGGFLVLIGSEIDQESIERLETLIHDSQVLKI